MNICFTGTSKGDIGYDYNTSDNQNFKIGLYSILDKLLKETSDSFTFYCGGALQFDQVAQLVCTDIRRKYPDRVKIVMAIPFKTHGSNWVSDSCLDVYRNLLETADKVVYTEDIPKYNDTLVPKGECSYYKYILRDHYMVDETVMTISCHDGVSKGTKATMDYTLKCGHELVQLDYYEVLDLGYKISEDKAYSQYVKEDRGD